MSLRYIYHKEAPEWWDAKVAEHGGTLFSSVVWANMLKSIGVGSSYFVEITEYEKPIILYVLHNVLLSWSLLVNLPTWILKTLNKFAILNGLTAHLQPVILDNSLYHDQKRLADISNEVMLNLFNFAKRKGSSIFPFDYICFNDLELAKVVTSKLSDATELGTTRILLNGSVEEVFASLNKSLRYSIKKGLDMGIVTKSVEEKVFYTELYNSWKKYGLALNPFNYYNYLKKHCPNNIEYYLSYYKETPVAGAGIMFFGQSIVEFSMFVSESAKKLVAPGGEVLKWEIIQHGIEKGYKFFDLNMINVQESKTQKISDINFFKLKWGGQILYGFKIEKLNGVLKLVRTLKKHTLGV